jgi:hypothetical protein
MKLVFIIVGFLTLAYSASLPFNADMVGQEVESVNSDVKIEPRTRSKRWGVDLFANVGNSIVKGFDNVKKCVEGECKDAKDVVIVTVTEASNIVQSFIPL